MTGAPVVTLEIAASLPRKCGDCQLCCKLLPVQEIEKKAGHRCRHQAHGKGCRVYHTALPRSCRLWSCAWLTGVDTGSRPDRAHLVVDMLPDFVTVVDETTFERRSLPVVHGAIVPVFPDAPGDPALRAYLAKRGEEGVAALIRSNEREAFTLLPPVMTEDGDWVAAWSNVDPEKQHSFTDIAKVWAGK